MQFPGEPSAFFFLRRDQPCVERFEFLIRAIEIIAGYRRVFQTLGHAIEGFRQLANLIGRSTGRRTPKSRPPRRRVPFTSAITGRATDPPRMKAARKPQGNQDTHDEKPHLQLANWTESLRRFHLGYENPVEAGQV